VTPDEATWVRENVLDRIHGLLMPRIAGQTTCLHIPHPRCDSCRLGYHRICTGLSWGGLHAGWIRNRYGSYIYWTGDAWWWCRVWIAPRQCTCSCVKNGAARPEPIPTSSPAAAASLVVDSEQPGLGFDGELTP
jgi:hypothetical protein